jgi:hypothetical protein
LNGEVLLMLAELTRFVSLLRQAGVRVSPGETKDFFRSVELLGFEREQLLAAALSTLAKEEKDRRLLEKFFRLNFAPPSLSGLLSPFAGGKAGDKAARPRLFPEEFAARLDGMKSSLRREVAQIKAATAAAYPSGSGTAGCGGSGRGRPNPVAAERGATPGSLAFRERAQCALAAGNREAMTVLAREAAREAVAAKGACDYARLLAGARLTLGWSEAASGLEKDDPPGAAENLRRFDALVREELDRELWWTGIEEREKTPRRANLAEVDFSRLDLNQVGEIKKKVARLARRLATRPSYRWRPSKRGRLDLRRTARRAGQTGGVALHLCRRERIRSRPVLAVLCDLSGSVAVFTEFMLLLVYAMHKKFRSVRSFVFVDDVEEISSRMAGGDPVEALTSARRTSCAARTPFSDYGAVWRSFCRNYLDTLAPGTSLVVLGDARSNWRHPETGCLARIRERVSRLIWLNPTPRHTWDKEDSIMSTFAPFCHYAGECRNLRQLEETARQIVLY